MQSKTPSPTTSRKRCPSPEGKSNLRVEKLLPEHVPLSNKLRGFLNYSEVPIVVMAVEWSSSYSVPRSLLASFLTPCSNAVYSQDEVLFLNKFIPTGTTWWQCRNETNWGVNGKAFSPLQVCSTHALQGLWFPVPGSFAAPKAERKKVQKKRFKAACVFLAANTAVCKRYKWDPRHLRLLTVTWGFT